MLPLLYQIQRYPYRAHFPLLIYGLSHRRNLLFLLVAPISKANGMYDEHPPNNLTTDLYEHSATTSHFCTTLLSICANSIISPTLICRHFSSFRRTSIFFLLAIIAANDSEIGLIGQVYLRPHLFMPFNNFFYFSNRNLVKVKRANLRI